MFFLLTRFLRFLCGLLPVLLMVLVYHLIKRKKDPHKNRKAATPHSLAVSLFCLYIFSVFFVTDIPDLYHFRLEPLINLILFDDILTNTVQYFLNILLFVPLGFLLPTLWTRFEKKCPTILFGALLSLFVELMQLFNYRATDIDDLLMNTVGTILGYVIYRWGKRVLPGCFVFSADGTSHGRGEPLLYVFLVWLCVFFVQPVFSRWLLGQLLDGRVIIG